MLCSDEPIVFIHGWASNRMIWQSLTKALSASGYEGQYHYINLPGHGGSPNNISVETQLLQIQSPSNVCAWSLGSLLVLKALSNNKLPFIKRLILFSPFCSFLERPNWQFGMSSAAFNAFSKRVHEQENTITRYFIALCTFGVPNARNWIRHGMSLHTTLPFPTREGIEKGLNQLETLDISTNLSQIECPVLLLSGKNDSLVSIEGVRMMSNLLPNAELVEFADAGHIPHIIYANECAQKIKLWLQQK